MAQSKPAVDVFSICVQRSRSPARYGRTCGSYLCGVKRSSGPNVRLAIRSQALIPARASACGSKNLAQNPLLKTIRKFCGKVCAYFVLKRYEGVVGSSKT